MERRSIASTFVRVLAVCSLLRSPCIAQEEPGRDERRATIKSTVEGLADEVADKTRDRVVGILVMGSKASVDPASLDRMQLGFEHALLSRGVLATPANRSSVRVLYDLKGRIKFRRLRKKENLTALTEGTGAKLLAAFVLSRRYGSEDPERNSCAVVVRVVDAETGKEVYKKTVKVFEYRDHVLLDGKLFLPDMNAAILKASIKNLGSRIGRGECWDLPASTMKSCGVKVSGYRFGVEVEWADAMAGDVLTVRNAKQKHVAVLRRKNGSGPESWTFEQNVDGKRFVTLESLAPKMADAMTVWRPFPPAEPKGVPAERDER